MARARKKRTFLDIPRNERSYFHRDGRWHRIFRAFHRPNRLGLPNEPRYAEVVVGEVVHLTSEPLAKHTRHGSGQAPSDRRELVAILEPLRSYSAQTEHAVRTGEDVSFSRRAFRMSGALCIYAGGLS